MEHLTAFLTRMPKVELHVHLESTMPGEMLARFAARQGRDGPFFRECGYTPYACYVTVSPLTRRSQTPKLPAK